MSFILDALRKSEHERRRGAAPGISQVPFALPRQRLPVWVPLAIGGLVLALLAVGGAWWRSVDAPAVAALPATPPAERHAESVSAVVAAPAIPTTQAAPPAPRNDTPPATRIETVETTIAAAPVAADPAAGAAPAAATPAPATPDSGASAGVATAPFTDATFAALPRATTLFAAGSLPRLNLELLVYAAQPDKRFVFVNGKRYAEGAELAEGPAVVAITTKGVVLRHQGRDFALLQE